MTQQRKYKQQNNNQQRNILSTTTTSILSGYSKKNYPINIWASSQQKPVFGVCKQQRHRQAAQMCSLISAFAIRLLQRSYLNLLQFSS